MTTTITLVKALGDIHPEKEVLIQNIPDYYELVENAQKYYHPGEEQI